MPWPFVEDGFMMGEAIAKIANGFHVKAEFGEAVVIWQFGKMVLRSVRPKDGIVSLVRHPAPKSERKIRNHAIGSNSSIPDFAGRFGNLSVCARRQCAQGGGVGEERPGRCEPIVHRFGDTVAEPDLGNV